jgi:hypothetical protein
MKRVHGKAGRRPAAKPQSSSEEPRTGVVHRLPKPSELAEAKSSSSRGIAQKPVPQNDTHAEDVRAWRRLEWPDRPSKAQPRAPAEPDVSIAQLSTNGEVARLSGADTWLPEAAEFVHRMSLLVAQGLGFDRSVGVCVRGRENVLSVYEAGPEKVVAVSGPARRLSNVLRRAGLE